MKELNKEIVKGMELLKTLDKIKRIQLKILKIDPRCISEIRKYRQPPEIVHAVMRSTLMILGIPETKTSEWINCQKHISVVSSDGLFSKIRTIEIPKISQDVILKAEQIIQNISLNEVKRTSAGVAAFYVWNKSNICHYKTLKSNEI